MAIPSEQLQQQLRRIIDQLQQQGCGGGDVPGRTDLPQDNPCHNTTTTTHPYTGDTDTRIGSANREGSLFGPQGFVGIYKHHMFKVEGKKINSYEQLLDLVNHRDLALQWGNANARVLWPAFASTIKNYDLAIRLYKNKEIPLTEKYVIRFIEDVKAK
jgi:hypothetical protein